MMFRFTSLGEFVVGIVDGYRCATDTYSICLSVNVWVWVGRFQFCGSTVWAFPLDGFDLSICARLRCFEPSSLDSADCMWCVLIALRYVFLWMGCGSLWSSAIRVYIRLLSCLCPSLILNVLQSVSWWWWIVSPKMRVSSCLFGIGYGW
jgi:hypothetical protein